MKSFKQFDEAYTDRFAHTSAEDDNKHLSNVFDEKVVQRLNGYVGSIADREYLQPEAAIKQLNNKLEIVGLRFAEPKVDSDKGNATVELTQFGGRYGKTPDNSNGPMSQGKEIEDGDGTLIIAASLVNKSTTREENLIPNAYRDAINYRCVYPINIRKNAVQK